MLTHAQKTTIRRTWGLVEPVVETVPDLFYKRLFDIAPQYRPLFKEDMSAQKRKLVSMLRFVVSALDWPDEFWAEQVSPDEDLVMVVAALGRRHAQLYQVPDEAYASVGEALLWTLDYGLGEAFTNEVREAWGSLYGLLSQCMIMSSDVSGSGTVIAAGNR
jgi:hemoglobin-like flavoprotein